jgi:hypothetical protein
MKILVPPEESKRKFRDALYAVGFQAPFSMQSHPPAARAGALWQKLVRRAAKLKFGTEDAVKDIFCTFIDSRLGSCGELSEWVEGRQWRFESDNYLDIRRLWRQGLPVPQAHLGSAEYRAKKTFMAQLVELLHDMGAPELARQYEWYTCKSQPNVMKRDGHDNDPAAGLTAMDFRAGLTLLPFLPMSPGDFPLIWRGLKRGSLVQFDRPDMDRFGQFIADHPADFADLADAVAELKAAEHGYRESMVDVTHHGARLLRDRPLWRTILDSTIASWRLRNLTDNAATVALRKSTPLTLGYIAAFVGVPMLAALWMLAVAAGCLAHWHWPTGGNWAAIIFAGAICVLASKVRRAAGRIDYRKHYENMISDSDYLRRALRAHRMESLVAWVRAGRVREGDALAMTEDLVLYLAHLPLSILPAGLHRFITDPQAFRAGVRAVFVRPVELYFKPQAREEWLRQMVADGQKKGMVTPDDAATIEANLAEPYIQKYLKALAVHVCLMPVGHLVSLTVGIFLAMKYGHSLSERAYYTALVLAAFQVTPISPGSILRGLYVLYLMIRERNFKDYNIAVCVAFFKYIGYLAFPIQMAYRYPALARFMACHWATGAVHHVPVFGEHGALLEHAAFDAFYNFPITFRRRAAQRDQVRSTLAPRFLPTAMFAVGGALALAVGDAVFLGVARHVPHLKEMWFLMPPVALAGGYLTAFRAGGMRTLRRIFLGVGCGVGMGILNGLANRAIAVAAGMNPWTEDFARDLGIGIFWRVFLFGLLAAIGAIVEELRVSDSVVGDLPKL